LRKQVLLFDFPTDTCETSQKIISSLKTHDICTQSYQNLNSAETTTLIYLKGITHFYIFKISRLFFGNSGKFKGSNKLDDGEFKSGLY